MDLDDTTIRKLRDTHKTRYWNDEEYITLYDQLNAFIDESISVNNCVRN